MTSHRTLSTSRAFTHARCELSISTSSHIVGTLSATDLTESTIRKLVPSCRSIASSDLLRGWRGVVDNIVDCAVTIAFVWSHAIDAARDEKNIISAVTVNVHSPPKNPAFRILTSVVKIYSPASTHVITNAVRASHAHVSLDAWLAAASSALPTNVPRSPCLSVIRSLTKARFWRASSNVGSKRSARS